MVRWPGDRIIEAKESTYSKRNLRIRRYQNRRQILMLPACKRNNYLLIFYPNCQPPRFYQVPLLSKIFKIYLTFKFSSTIWLSCLLPHILEHSQILLCCFLDFSKPNMSIKFINPTRQTHQTINLPSFFTRNFAVF